MPSSLKAWAAVSTVAMAVAAVAAAFSDEVAGWTALAFGLGAVAWLLVGIVLPEPESGSPRASANIVPVVAGVSILGSVVLVIAALLA